ncbi:SDR family NAD(P)-dependent oxidoreductase [Rhizobium sp. S152]|uniref:SDR family NAD(P)-dependent oxidoreductase n=1 Tax=Rhizobium sp. S152 TaxID=3055038 RepID=UPI0025A9F5F3|nr:SDR family NAD(P)-dependent oxidoreductase [Rhizobium sp. S152]MDM9628478.1 SDR family NAD(P)-dependent oxidoreductase [Rhizobium sp. S152]
MGKVFITGSNDGLGLAAARSLARAGHEVVLHARSQQRADAVSHLFPDASHVVIGDLSKADHVRSLASQVNDIGRMDAIIHNAGVYLQPDRGNTPEGHATTLAVNTLAPYMLTALIERPERLVYLSSGMHRSGDGSLADIDWQSRQWQASTAYSESKLHVAALALAVARLWPDTLSNAVDPGWVPTKMGGASATDDLEMGHQTQAWLAVENDRDATTSGGYWYHRQRQQPSPAVEDVRFQDSLLLRLSEMTGVRL